MAKIVLSEKEKDLIVHNDYIFEKQNVKGNNVYWRCSIRTCRSKITTKGDYAVNLGLLELKVHHNHPSDPISVLKREKVNAMKFDISQSMGHPRKIISAALRGADRDLIMACGTIETLSKQLRNYRTRVINPKPYQFSGINLGYTLSNTYRNELLYQYGPGNYRGLPEYDDFLLFYSDSLYTILQKESILCVDGTFKVIPSPYLQLYTISILRNNSVFPVVFAVCKNKENLTYSRVFSIRTQLNGNINPKVIKTDFEIASINALANSFPKASISGCLFHLGQNIQRKLKQLNIFQYYNNTNERIFIKALSALALVTIDKIEETFYEIFNSPEFPEVVRPLYSYFYKNYINTRSARFPTSIWNHAHHTSIDVPRTNNAIEGFHNAFNNSFGGSKYNLYLLIKNIKDEEENCQQRLIRNEMGETFYRKKKYILLEERLTLYLVRNISHFGKLLFLI